MPQICRVAEWELQVLCSATYATGGGLVPDRFRLKRQCIYRTSRWNRVKNGVWPLLVTTKVSVRTQGGNLYCGPEMQSSVDLQMFVSTIVQGNRSRARTKPFVVRFGVHQEDAAGRRDVHGCWWEMCSNCLSCNRLQTSCSNALEGGCSIHCLTCIHGRASAVISNKLGSKSRQHDIGTVVVPLATS
jgi:hypothetical protein